MRTTWLMLALSVLLGLAVPAHAQRSEGASYKGIWVSTPFPSFHTGTGETVTLDLNVHNRGLPPQRVALRLERVPPGWSAAFLGEGKQVESVFVAPGDKAGVKLRLEPSADAGPGTHRFEVVAAGSGARFRLPLEITLGQSLPPRLTLRPELPELRGSPTSDFEFKVAVRNDGGDDVAVRFDVAAPEGFRTRVTEQYGSQELTSLPLKVGEEKTLSVKLTPPFGVKEGSYPARLVVSGGRAQADTALTMEITGEARLQLTGRDERLSASAVAGDETPIELVVQNEGTASAQGIRFDATSPTGWKVDFRPERLEALAPGERQTVKALVTPSTKAIAGDYMITVRAETGSANKSSDFRVTVRTSTLWGVAGVLVIAAAVVVLVAAMMRYGRR